MDERLDLGVRETREATSSAQIGPAPCTPWTGRHTAALLSILAAVGLIDLLASPSLRLWAWLVTLTLLGISTMVIGQGATGLKLGLLIDARNRLSLSRMQIIFWTILILSSLLVAALGNVNLGEVSPLSIKIPPEVLGLIGISATSLVGAPLILSTKKGRTDSEKERSRDPGDAAGRDTKPKEISKEGQIIVNDVPQNAGISNLFKGDEVGNFVQIALGKTQLFYFTVVLVFIYGVVLGKLFASSDAVHQLPAIDPGLVWLLGISHAGYLANKAVPHSSPNAED